MRQNKYLKGLLEPLLLKLLQEQGKMYGYEITQRVKELTGSEIKLTEGALYPLLHKLEASGVIVATSEVVHNRVRRYYTLTEAGHRQSSSAIADLHQFMTIMNQLLKPQVR